MFTTNAVTLGVRLKTPPAPLIPKPSLRLPLPPCLALLPTNPNPRPCSSSASASLRFSPVSSSRGGWSRRATTRCSAVVTGAGGLVQGGGADYEHEHVLRPRPAEIPWRKELANAVHLIGVVAAPVQIKHVSSGKVLAWTRIGVKTSSSDTTWINLTLWDDLAHIAFQHVEKGQQIYVCGRLVADSVVGDENKRQVYYKVVVQQLNFIERSFPPVSSYGADSGSLTKAGAKVGNYTANKGSSPEELWQAFFVNPMDWWDNRKNKRNPKAPDFKHKHTGEAIWIEGRYNPPWVKSQLAILDSRMSSLQANDTNPSLSLMHGGELTHF